jgi:DNA-binding response OmpR family regulator/anti-anti-sigma regulatory factor
MQNSYVAALVLVADDNPINLEVLASAFASEGLPMAGVTDGEEVLDVVGRETPDLILLDVLMPGLDGFETCRRLKANPKTRDIPVIFMTSLTEEHHRIQGFSVGAIDYVTKPFQQAELLARVRTHISLRKATRAIDEQNARLSHELHRRATAEQALADAVQKLERRTEDLQESNARLSHELHRREQAEAARAALQEQIIAVQRERLLELSAPLIPITGGILVMPLVGTMDEARAAQAIETALRGASASGAHHLIIDITGIKAADTTVADLLVQAARGLELLGTRTVVTGIRPDVAQAFVQLHIPLALLVTKATLRAGVEHALWARPRKTRPSANSSYPRAKASRRRCRFTL